MRILEILSGRKVNGAIIHCLELTRQLALRGHELTFLVRPEAWAGKQSFPPGVEVLESHMHPSNLREVWRISKLIEERKIDVIHTHQSRANFFGVMLRRLFGHTCVATAHNRLIQLHWMWNDHIIAATAATARFQQRYNFCSKNRMSVVHCFVDWDRFNSVPSAAGEVVRQSFGVSADTLLMGVVGTVCKRKGLNYLIQALPEIVAKHPHTKILVVGKEEQPFGRECRALAARLGVAQHLVWAGQRLDTPELLRALDVFVLPTLEDQFPIAIMEAMSSGLPVVATDVGGISEGVHHRQNGFLVRSANTPDLVNALDPLLADKSLRQKIGRTASEYARCELTPHVQSGRIEAILQKVIARRAKERSQSWNPLRRSA